MELQVKNEKRNHRWFTGRLFKSLLGIWIVPIFVIAIEGEIKIEARRQEDKLV